MRPLAVILVFTLVSAASSGEEIDTKRKAKAHFTAGTALFEAGEYGRAIEEYGETYRLFPVPDLLFNLGQAHRLGGNPKAAVDFYKRYLAARPTGPIADEAREHLREVSVAESEAARNATSPAPPVSASHAVAQPPAPSPQRADPKPTALPNKKHWAWDDAAMVEVQADGKTTSAPNAANVEETRPAATKNPDKPKKRRSQTAMSSQSRPSRSGRPSMPSRRSATSPLNGAAGRGTMHRWSR